MPETRDRQALPQIPPPPTRIVDNGGRMTKEFYDYLLRLKAAIEAQLAAARAKQ